ncbi:hypothetical protein [Limnovirga soli]|uniref:Uncharacterized protein n=1 Tax=Limnovirga soli TaxID=2656915 RepID=A0A8J8JQT4_9BACT|nr:hypothetical protein [Limnovirga soli]NNV55082.1 hypothetical protein [Limnovirga soli]
MQKKVKNRTRIIALSILGIFIFSVVKIYNGFLQNEKALTEDLPSTYSLTLEDSNLISKKYQGKLKVIEVYQSKVRAPIAILDFDNKYHLIMYKMILQNDVSLENILHVEMKSVDLSTGYSYGTIGRDIIYRFRYKAGAIKPASALYLTLAGDSLQKVEINDTIINYHLLADNFSIRYSKEDPVDILVIGQERPLGETSIVPIDCLFLKRNRSVYLLLMTPINANASIEPHLLYNIVTGN